MSLEVTIRYKNKEGKVVFENSEFRQRILKTIIEASEEMVDDGDLLTVGMEIDGKSDSFKLKEIEEMSKVVKKEAKVEAEKANQTTEQ